MFRKLLTTFFLFLFVISASAFGQVKIGYVNTQEVLSQMPERSTVQQELSSFVQQKRQELQQRTMAFQDSLAAFQQAQPSMSDAQAQQTEQKLTEEQNSIRQLQQSVQQQIQQRRVALLEPLYNKMNQAIADVAEDNNIDFVLSEATGGGENVVYYSASEKLNLTQDVLNHINETSAKN